MVGTGSTYVILTDVNIATTGIGASGIGVGSGSSNLKTMVINGGTIDAAQSYGLGVNIRTGSPGSAEQYAGYNGTIDITIKGGADISGGQGSIYATNILTGTNTMGDLVDVDTPMIINIRLEEASSLEGDVIILGSASATLNLGENSTLTGNITGSGSSTTRVSLDNSTLTGDITQGDDSRVVIELNNGSSGTGGFSGGDLKINDSNSRWNFNQDSRPDWIHVRQAKLGASCRVRDPVGQG